MKFKITLLLSKVETILKQEGLEYTKLAYSYYLTYAWYHTYVEPDNDKAAKHIRRAYGIGIKICDNDLDFVDDLIVPIANIFLECGKEEDAAKWLKRGIKLCEENEEILPYVRKKMELQTYLLDVYSAME